MRSMTATVLVLLNRYCQSNVNDALKRLRLQAESLTINRNGKTFDEANDNGCSTLTDELLTKLTVKNDTIVCYA